MNLLNIMKRITEQAIKPPLIGSITFLLSTSLFANPVLDNVAAGQVSIQQAPNSTVINQASQKAIINWQSFNIGAQESTHFQQPQGGIALNRINPSQGVSQIYGRLTATGQIILVNPAGIFFGPGAYVNVGGLIASTANITDSDFLNNYYHFANVPGYNGAVINQGQIIAAENGLVALIGGAVSNSGMIEANMGHAILASGDSLAMTFTGNDLVSFSVDSGVHARAVDKDGNVIRNGVSNTGSIYANGGQILISAKDAAGVLDNVIRMQGIAVANSVSDGANKHDGEIILMGDADRGVIEVAGSLTSQSGTIIVKGYNLLVADGSSFDVSSLTGDGGFVETSGTHGLSLGNLSINTGAPQGKAGTWLIDPADIDITTVNANITGGSPFTATATGSTLNVATLVAALASGNVTVLTTNDGFIGSGNITVSSGITWTSANTLLLQAFNNIIINAPISGVNGSLNLFAVNGASSITTGASGTVDVNNFNLLQGQWQQVGTLPAFNVRNNFQINSGTMPNAIAQFIRATGGNGTAGTPYVLTDVYGLQGMGSTTSTITQSFNLGGNIDATSTSRWNSGAGFVPIGNVTNNFSGRLNGLNIVDNSSYSITNLYESQPSAVADHMGLFGQTTGATISNLNLVNATIRLNFNTFAGGILAGRTLAGTTISNTSTSGTITFGLSGSPVSGFARMGGMTGENQGTIINSFTTANVSAYQGSNTFINVGGFTGNNIGTISTSYSAGNVFYSGGSFNSGRQVGGFNGANFGTINTSYSTASVTIGGSASSNLYVGGFAGQNNSGPISNSYSSGLVTNTIGGFTGGFTGQNASTFANNFYDTQTSGMGATAVGTGSAANINGRTTAQMMALSTFTAGGWSGTAGVGGSITNVPSTTSTAPNYTWYIFEGSTRPMLMMEKKDAVSNPHQLQMMGSTLGGAYTLANNIDLTSALTNTSDVWATNYNTPTGSGFAPIGAGSAATAFQGTFNGQNFVINNLYINRPTTNFVGLFGANIGNGTTISNLGLTNVNITGQRLIGGLVGQNGNGVFFGFSGGSGTTVGNTTSNISNVYVTGTVTGIFASGRSIVGGLIGVNTSGSISNAYSTANIVAQSQGGAGGLFGENYGNVTNAYATGNITSTLAGTYIGGFSGFAYNGTISNSYSSGNIYAANGSTYVGGFLGSAEGEIGGTNLVTNSYSISSIYTSNSTNVGGFIGNMTNTVHTGTNTTVSNSYSSGSITGTGNTNTGGFIGLINYPSGSGGSATINNNFWDIGSTGQTAGYGTTIGTLFTVTNLFGGCFAGGGTCATQATITNATNAGGNIVPKDLSVLATYNTGGPTWSITSTPSLTATAPAFTWFIFEGGTRPMLMMEQKASVSNAHQLQMMGSTLGGNYTLANNIDLSSSLTNTSEVWGTNYQTPTGGGFVPVGRTNNPPTTTLEFRGTFNGQNNVISNLYINRSSAQNGLFGAAISSTIQNVALANVNISASSYTSGLVGYYAWWGAAANISNISVTGSINGNGGSAVAGIVGYLGVGTITNAYNGANITGGSQVGGLVGLSDVSSTVTNSYNTGSVTGTQNVGGLIGYMNDYNTGPSEFLTNSYNSGAVSGTTNVGGAVGYATPGTGQGPKIQQVFWDVDTSGQINGIGNAGVNNIVNLKGGCFSGTCISQPGALSSNSGAAVNLSALATYSGAGWSITATPSTTSTSPNNTWFIFEGNTRPILMMENTPNIVNAHNLQMMGAALNGSYTQMSYIDFTSPMTNTSEVWGTNSATLTGQGFVPVGQRSSNLAGPFFTGSFNGNGYVINKLYINYLSSAGQDIGLFGSINNALISNAQVTNVNITSASSTANNQTTAALVGEAVGTSKINNSWVSGTVTGLNIVGGLLGATWMDSSGVIGVEIANSYSIANVQSAMTLIGSSPVAGGLVGQLNSSSLGTIRITNSYSSGTASGFLKGGLIGLDNSSGEIITNSYWDTQSSGLATSGGGTGLTTAQMMTLSSFSAPGWSITGTPSTTSTAPSSTWFIFSGQTRPMLMIENNSLVTNPHQLQMMGAALGGNYTLNNNIDFTTVTSTADVWNMDFSAYSGVNPLNVPSTQGFIPIGSSSQPFSGNFDGQGYSINRIYTYKPLDDSVGLFSETASSATIRNINLTDPLIWGNNQVGGITGINRGTIDNVNVTTTFVPVTSVGGYPWVGNVTIVGSSTAGGISGTNNGIISNSQSSANVTAGNGTLGGITGVNNNLITDSFSTGWIAPIGGSIAGGLAARNNAGGSITRSFNSGNIYAGYYSVFFGGLVAYNEGVITKSYNTGGVNTGFANTGTGGLVAYNSPTGVISDSYNAGYTAYGQGSNGGSGSFVGINDGTISRSYTYGVSYYQYDPVNVVNNGFVGVNNGTINDSYFDVSTTGYTRGYGANTGVINGLYGGCLGNTSCHSEAITNATNASNSPVDLTSPSTFANWDMVNVWNIIPSHSYPYLRDFYTSAPRAISGIHPSGLHFNNVSLAVNGNIQNSTSTNFNGAFYSLAGYNNISKIDNSIPDLAGIVAFSTSGVYANYVTYAPTNNASMSVINQIVLTPNTITASTSETNIALITPLSNSQVINAINGLSSPYLLLSNSGNNLIVADGYHLTIPQSTPYLLDGNIALTNGTLTFNGPLTISAASATVTSNISGDILLNNTVTLGSAALFNLTGNGMQSITFNGNITGTQDITLQGSGTGTYHFTINGLSANDVNILAAAGSTNNLLTLNTGNTQNFMITGTDVGNVTALLNVNSFNFNNIHNLTGGSGADTFTFNGGNLSGSINGGLGVNTLIGANVANTWTINANNGGLFSGMSGTFANIQNLIGGTDVDDFNFVEGFTVNGVIMGGDATLTSANSIRFDTFSASNLLHLRLGMPVARNINSRVVQAIDVGAVWDSNNIRIARFEEIQVGYGNNVGKIYFPKEPSINYKLYDVTGRNGEVGDPFYFYGWNIDPSTLPGATVAATPPSSLPPANSSVAQVVQQPTTNAEDNTDYSSESTSGLGYDPTVLNKTYKTPLLETTNVSVGAACYKVVQ